MALLQTLGVCAGIPFLSLALNCTWPLSHHKDLYYHEGPESDARVEELCALQPGPAPQPFPAWVPLTRGHLLCHQ